MTLIELNQNFLSNTQYLDLFLLTVSILWISLVIHSIKKYGIKPTIRYFLPIMIVSLFLELTATSIGNFYYSGYLIYFSIMGGHVPLIILMGWSASLYLYLHMGKYIVLQFYKKQNFFQIFLMSFLAGLFALLFDMLEDPIAHHNNWWIWTKESAVLEFFEVPLSNFMGWFIIIGGMSLITLYIERTGFSELRKYILSFSTILIVFIPLVVYFRL